MTDRDPLGDFANRIEIDTEIDIGFPEEADSEIKMLADKVNANFPSGRVRNKSPIIQVEAFVKTRMDTMGHVLPLPPYDQILRDERHWEVLKDCLDIIEKYRQYGYDINAASANEDLLRIGGNLAHLGGVVGYLSAAVNHAESAASMAKSRAYVSSKVARDELSISVTDLDAKEISKVASEEYEVNHKYLDLVAQTIRNSFYAIRHFADELGRIASRSNFNGSRNVQQT